jgi:hypothetical protein
MARPTILGLAFLLLAAAASNALGADEPFDVEKARKLLRELGAPKFSAREAATDSLLKMGVDVLPVLSEGVRHPDREIRHRSNRLLDIVRQADFSRRLAAFDASNNDSEDFGLPMWTKFRDLVGPGRETRRVFVEMQKAESSLLRSAAESDEQTKSLLAERMQDLQNQLRFFPQGLPTGTTASLLFVSGNEKVQTPDQHGWVIYNYVMQQPFAEQLRNGARRDILRRLLGAWIRTNTSGATAYQAMMMAMQYDLSEALVPAEKMITQGGQAPQVRQFAILSIARFGDPTWLAKLEPLLDDGAVCMQSDINRVRYTTQIRDIALVAMIHLSKQEPKRFGFDNVRPNPQYVFDAASLGFKNDDERNAARTKWQAFVAEMKK